MSPYGAHGGVVATPTAAVACPPEARMHQLAYYGSAVASPAAPALFATPGIQPPSAARGPQAPYIPIAASHVPLGAPAGALLPPYPASNGQMMGDQPFYGYYPTQQPPRGP
jgi:hypothetical protein